MNLKPNSNITGARFFVRRKKGVKPRARRVEFWLDKNADGDIVLKAKCKKFGESKILAIKHDGTLGLFEDVMTIGIWTIGKGIIDQVGRAKQ